MSQLITRLGCRYSSVGSLDRPPAKPSSSEWESAFDRRQSDRLPSAQPATVSKDGPRRVVLVEGDQYYREMLTGELLHQGFVVQAFADGAALLNSLADTVDADIVVLDWDLPKMPGINLLARLRQHGTSVPVVFLTGKFIPGDEQCLLAPREALNAYEYMAFDQGAADFISKSRDRQVLVRRLRRVIELVKPHANVAVEERLACGKLLLKPEGSRACWNGVDVGLTLGEYKIVHLLASNAGSFVTYRTLYDRLRYEGFVAGNGKDGFRANVRTVVKRIRGKFRACDPACDEIENYTGFGYCWRKPS
jgi:two-component system, OmpR family, response regulator ChvI